MTPETESLISPSQLEVLQARLRRAEAFRVGQFYSPWGLGVGYITVTEEWRAACIADATADLEAYLKDQQEASCQS